MENKELLQKVGQLGFPLLEVEEKFDADETLAEVVKSNETRLLEGFPVLLANAAKRAAFDYGSVEQHLSGADDKKRLKELYLLSLALYEGLRLKFAWTAGWQGKAARADVLMFKEFQKKVAQDQPVQVGGRPFSPQRLKDVFATYFEQEMEEVKRQAAKNDSFSLEYALSQVFSPKQKELFLKRVKGLELNKTEREYFSRVVKKKALALANPELNRLAAQLTQ